MRMTVGQLRRIIRETVEEEMVRQDLNEGFLDSIKDFFGGKKISHVDATDLMGPWKGELPYGFEGFRDILKKFEEGQRFGKTHLDSESVWSWIKQAVAQLILDTSKGKFKPNKASVHALRKAFENKEKGKKEQALISLVGFIEPNIEEIKKTLFNFRSFKTGYEEMIRGLERGEKEAKEIIEKEKLNKRLEKERAESEERWKIYGQEQRRAREKESDYWKPYGSDDNYYMR